MSAKAVNGKPNNAHFTALKAEGVRIDAKLAALKEARANDACLTNKPIEELPEIPGLMDNIWNAMDYQHKLITELNDKLYPVMPPDGIKYPAEDAPAEVGSRSPLGERLNDLLQIIHAANRRISDMVALVRL
jgi:hypothetical protein